MKIIEVRIAKVRCSASFLHHLSTSNSLTITNFTFTARALIRVNPLPQLRLELDLHSIKNQSA